MLQYTMDSCAMSTILNISGCYVYLLEHIDVRFSRRNTIKSKAVSKAGERVVNIGTNIYRPRYCSLIA